MCTDLLHSISSLSYIYTIGSNAQINADHDGIRKWNSSNGRRLHRSKINCLHRKWIINNHHNRRDNQWPWSAARICSFIPRISVLHKSMDSDLWIIQRVWKQQKTKILERLQVVPWRNVPLNLCWWWFPQIVWSPGWAVQQPKQTIPRM